VVRVFRLHSAAETAALQNAKVILGRMPNKQGKPEIFVLALFYNSSTA
jgi:hypothetical protein